MDAEANETSPTINPQPQRNIVPPQVRAPGHLSGETGVPNLLNRSSPVECQATWMLAYTSGMREVKIHELREAVKSGTYHVAAEQIADTMLRDRLGELLS